MKHLKCGFAIFFLVSILLLPATLDLKRIAQWQHDEIFMNHFYSLIDHDDQLLGVFYKSGICVISEKKIVKFGTYGEGPSELLNLQALFNYKDGCIAALERPDKLKIFKKADENYVWKETRWLKRGKYFHVVKNGIFFDNKFFLAGCEATDREMTTAYFLRILDEKGKLLKQLIERHFEKPNQFHLMKYYIDGYMTDTVFFLPENELKITVLSSKGLEIVKEVALETPGFYKQMPEDFYMFKKYGDSKDFRLDIEKWAMGYSRITNFCIENDYLVIQIRTCSEKLKKFAVLFYNAKTYKLEGTVFIDDFLLATKDGKYYFFANGNPGRDDDTDECIINIYSLEKSAQ